MNHIRISSPSSEEQGGEGVDLVLRQFFQSEMPNPWPEAPHGPLVLQPPRPRQSLKWLKTSRRRLALAASLALFIGGYWTLSHYFPTAVPGSQNSLEKLGTIGKGLETPNFNPSELMKEPLPGINGESRTVPTRNGGAARIWEQQLPNNKIIIRVEEMKQPKRQP